MEDSGDGDGGVNNGDGWAGGGNVTFANNSQIERFFLVYSTVMLLVCLFIQFDMHAYMYMVVSFNRVSFFTIDRHTFHLHIFFYPPVSST